MMKNLLSMEHLTNEEILYMLDRAQAFENGEESKLTRAYHVANLFLNRVHERRQVLKWLNVVSGVPLSHLMQDSQVL